MNHKTQYEHHKELVNSLPSTKRDVWDHEIDYWNVNQNGSDPYIENDNGESLKSLILNSLNTFHFRSYNVKCSQDGFGGRRNEHFEEHIALVSE